MTTTQDIEKSLRKLSLERKENWLAWFEKLEAVAKDFACKSDEGFEPSSQDFIDRGYTQSEADALVFAMAQEYMGRTCDNIDMVDRWFQLNF